MRSTNEIWINFRAGRYAPTVPVFGAIVLFLMFLLMNQGATSMLQSLAEDTQNRYLGNQPLSDVILVIMLAAAISSALIMLFWPRFEAPRPQMVVKHYFGHADATTERERASQQLRLPVMRYFLTAIAQLRRVRAYLGFAG
jgi:hypothetical protein